MASYRPVAPEYFSPGFAESACWLAFLGLDTAFLYSDIIERRNLAALPDSTPMKADLLWEKTKEVIISSAQTVSTLSITLNSLARAQYIPLSIFATPIAFFAYSGRAFSSLMRLWESGKEFGDFSTEKEGIKNFFVQLQTLLKVAFYVTSAAWGVLGVVSTCLGIHSLFTVVDLLFCHSALLGCAHLLALIGVSLMRDEEKIECI